MSETAIVKAVNISKKFYNDEGELEVLRDINLSLEKGKITGLLGPSGSGKSTILNILTGLLQPTSGELEIRGKMGYMFQRDHLLDWRKIMDNILIGLEIQKKVNDENRERVEELLKKYDLWSFRNRYPKELSGGMRQRVALIRTLAVGPDVLLLDEPFSALDYQTRIMVSDDIYKIIKEEDIAALMVTHDISEAIGMCDDINVLSKRPATIRAYHEVKLTVDGQKTPLTARKAVEFKDYFDLLWKELQDDAER